MPLPPDERRDDAAPDVPRLPLRGHDTEAAAAVRRRWISERTGADLEALSDYAFAPEALAGNIENFVGAAHVPIGIAGPLLVRGDAARGLVYAPFATTEGALVASASRGARAASLAGGVRVRVARQTMVRAPLFVFDGLDDAFRLADWLADHEDDVRRAAESASRYARLTALRPFVVGHTLHVRFEYETGDAAGQNMTTACTWRACRWVLDHMPDLGLRHFTVEANLSGDKKAAFASVYGGRGARVVAEVLLPDDVLRDVLKVSADALVETAGAFAAGSLQAGLVGFNVNVANTVAALFVATGQDVASVHESSVAHLDVRRRAEGVYASLLLPSLIVGTVGGGTALPTQRACLAMLDCVGAGRSRRLAEIIAAFALALDLSTLAAITSGDFATAHERLGRNRPEDGLQDADLTPERWAALLGAPGAEAVRAVRPRPVDASASILSSLTARLLRKRVGHFGYDVDLVREGEPRTHAVVLKAKATDAEVIDGLTIIARGCGEPLASAFEARRFEIGFRHTHLRELAVAAMETPALERIRPRVYGTWRDDAREIYVLAMERLEDVTHFGTENDPGAWRPDDVAAALADLARFHAVHYDRADALVGEPWMDPPTAARAARLEPLWHALVAHHANVFPDLYPPPRAARAHAAAEAAVERWPLLEAAPRTLIHNDFNPRNVCLRRAPDGPRLCAYDWELATVHVPQHDVAEFLAFVLPPDTPPADRRAWLHRYRDVLAGELGRAVPAAPFEAVFDLVHLDLLVHRLGLYGMVHTVKDYRFLPRVLDGVFRYVEATEWER